MSVQQNVTMAAGLETARQAGRAAAALEGLEQEASRDRARRRGIEDLRHWVFRAGQLVERAQALLDRDPEGALYLATHAASHLADVGEADLPELVDKHYVTTARSAAQAMVAHTRALLPGGAGDDVVRLVWLEQLVPAMRDYLDWREAHGATHAPTGAGRWALVWLGAGFVGGGLRNAGGLLAGPGFLVQTVAVIAFGLMLRALLRGRRATRAMQTRLDVLGARTGERPAGSTPAEAPGRRWRSADTQRALANAAKALGRQGYDVGEGPLWAAAAEVAQALAPLEADLAALRARYPRLSALRSA